MCKQRHEPHARARHGRQGGAHAHGLNTTVVGGRRPLPLPAPSQPPTAPRAVGGKITIALISTATNAATPACCMDTMSPWSAHMILNFFQYSNSHQDSNQRHHCSPLQLPVQQPTTPAYCVDTMSPWSAHMILNAVSTLQARAASCAAE